MLLGIDLGTSSLKVLLLNENGVEKALSSRGYQFASPRNGYAEQDPEEWWRACCEAIQEVLHSADIRKEEIKGLSFSGQMHGVVMLTKEYHVVRPAILHCDARSGKQVKELKEKLGNKKNKEIIMNPIYTGFLLPSLLWVKENELENYEKIAYIMLPKDYLRFRMTGMWATDYSDASATLAYNVSKNCWSDEVLMAADISRAFFPDCVGTTEVVGNVCKEAAKETGLSEKTIVIAGGGDQVMQGIGNGIVDAGEASVNIGTSGQVSFQSKKAILNPNLNTNTFTGYEKGRWFTMGAIMNAGLAYRWFNDLFDSLDFDSMNQQIAKVKPGSGGLVFLPYLNGERTPHLNPNISGAFVGLNINTGRAEMSRAVMEGVSFALNQCIEVCGDLGLHAKTMVASGGACKSAIWLQIQSDVYGCPLRVATTEEQASLGAAIAAGVGCGIYKSIREGCKTAVKYKDKWIEPDAKRHAVYKEYYEIYKEMYINSNEVLERLTLKGRN